MTTALAPHDTKRLLALKGWRDAPWWIERNFRIEETEDFIRLAQHQKAVLWYAFQRNAAGHLPYTTIVYSTPKKSGKTTIGGAVAQWVAETWGKYGEILCLGNDATQAKERGFAKLRQSVELSPGYRRDKGILPHQWKLLEAEATCWTTGTRVKAVATDYKGEAGANPTLSLWTELWGFINKAALRFWAEMAPSPTRADSVRFIETYAGYEGESELLWGLYEETVLNGRQLTCGELRATAQDTRLKNAIFFDEAPNDDSLVPCWVNDAAGIFAYWDSGDIAHRMPWQRGERGARYYASEASTQTPLQFDRIHRNLWVSSEGAFVPLEVWDACTNPWPLQPGEKTPMVVALDAAVSGDCFGMVAGCRDPNTKDAVVIRMSRKWSPPKGGVIDYSGPEEALRQFCKEWNVVQVAYDPYQLHDMATRLQKEGVAWFRSFGQGEERLKADKDLWTMIMNRRIRHDGNLDLREHIGNCNAKQSRDEDTKLRLVKKADTRKIDLAVCCSMMAKEVLRLNL